VAVITATVAAYSTTAAYSIQLSLLSIFFLVYKTHNMHHLQYTLVITKLLIQHIYKMIWPSIPPKFLILVLIFKALILWPIQIVQC
jgi:hypothetical protein